jgi:hypothetical protein
MLFNHKDSLLQKKKAFRTPGCITAKKKAFQTSGFITAKKAF